MKVNSVRRTIWFLTMTTLLIIIGFIFFTESQKKHNAENQAQRIVKNIELNTGQLIYTQPHDNGCEKYSSGWLGYYTNCSVSDNKFNKDKTHLLNALNKTAISLKEQGWITEDTIDQSKLDLAEENSTAAFWQFKSSREPNMY